MKQIRHWLKNFSNWTGCQPVMPSSGLENGFEKT